MDSGDIDLWSTHLPVLVAVVAKTQGPVLELGCGHYSTRVLHALCGAQGRSGASSEPPREAQGRQLLTLDTNPGWLARFKDLESPIHRVVYTDTIAEFVRFVWTASNGASFPHGGRWSVVFEDSGIAQRRPDNIAALRAITDLFVVNNTEPGRPVYQYERILPSFPYRWDYKRYPVWTSVISDSPLPDWLERLT